MHTYVDIGSMHTLHTYIHTCGAKDRGIRSPDAKSGIRGRFYGSLPSPLKRMFRS